MADDQQQDGIPVSSPEEEKMEGRVFSLVPLLLAPFFLVLASFLRHSYRMVGNVNGRSKVEFSPSFPLFQFAGVALYFYLAYVAFKKGFPGWGWIFASLGAAFNPFPAFATGIVSDPIAWGFAMAAAILLMLKALIDSPREEREL